MRLRTSGFPAKLTKRELQFLRREQVPTRWVFDASPFALTTIEDCKLMMDTATACLSIGFRSCESRHRLLNSKGRCVQCDPRLLLRTRRYIRHAYVYLAESPSMGLIKVGSCADVDKRQWQLNFHDHYAGACDWRIRRFHHTIAAEMFEADVRTHLPKPFDGFSRRYGKPQLATEAFRCSYRTAKRHFEAEIARTATLYAEIEAQCAAGS